jgi:hypothetical protein
MGREGRLRSRLSATLISILSPKAGTLRFASPQDAASNVARPACRFLDATHSHI